MMGNRYKSELKEHIEDYYKMPVIDALLMLQSQDKTYRDVSDETGFHVSTIRRFFQKYAVSLKTIKRPNEIKHKEADKVDFLSSFSSKKLNIANFLSRSWHC